MSNHAQHLKTEAEPELMPDKPLKDAADRPKAGSQRRRLQVTEIKPGPLVDPSEAPEQTPKPSNPARAAKPALRLKAEAKGFHLHVPAAPPIPRPVSAKRSQQPVDPKPFKPFTGTGAELYVLQAKRDVDSVHEKMRRLADLTSAYAKWGLRLTVHSRGQTNQRSLRWRGYRPGGRTGEVPRQEHLSWEQAEQRISTFPAEVRAQNGLWNDEATRLNAVEKKRRFALRNVEALVATGTASPSRAKAVIESILEADRQEKINKNK